MSGTCCVMDCERSATGAVSSAVHGMANQKPIRSVLVITADSCTARPSSAFESTYQPGWHHAHVAVRLHNIRSPHPPSFWILWPVPVWTVDILRFPWWGLVPIECPTSSSSLLPRHDDSIVTMHMLHNHAATHADLIWAWMPTRFTFVASISLIGICKAMLS